MEKDNREWDYVISARKSNLLSFKQVLAFKDLLFLLVKRDIVTIYKQTILGPAWLVLQPIITALTFTIIFGRMAGLSTDGVPAFLFYYSGILLWTLFTECTLKTSDTFVSNADLFGKVYFPRIIVPLSVVVTAGIKFAINLFVFLCVWGFNKFNGWEAEFNFINLLFLPLLALIMASMGFGLGITVSSLTAKYKDLRFLIQFGIQLLMYLSPVIFPLSMTWGVYRRVLEYNPVTSLIEGMRKIFLDRGELSASGLLYSGLFVLVLVALGVFIFNRTEKTFIDSV